MDNKTKYKVIEAKLNGELAFDNGGDFIADLFSEDLAGIGYDSFENAGDVLKCYVAEDLFSEVKLKEVIESSELYTNITYKVEDLEDKDWNEEWEKNYFQPIVVADQVVVCSEFHKNVPESKYKIIINPRMAFGTGHHQTTGLMMKNMLDCDFKGKTVMDMGCGTAILSILAAYLGAEKVDAVDIDVWAYENSIDNLVVNKVEDKIHVRQGDAATVENLNSVYDIFLANINRNILLNDIPRYANSIKENGKLILSGFYKEDIPAIEEVAKKHNFSLQTVKEKDNWVSICMNKQKC